MSVKLNYDGKVFTISIPADVAISMLLAGSGDPAVAGAIVDWVSQRPGGANWTEIHRKFGTQVPKPELLRTVLAAVTRGELSRERTRGGGHRYRATRSRAEASGAILEPVVPVVDAS